MNEHRHSGGGELLKLTDVCVVALYNSNGDIVHAHSIATSERGQAINEHEVVEAAKAIAKRVGHSIEELSVKISRNPAHALTPHRIDPVSGEFVVVTSPKHP